MIRVDFHGISNNGPKQEAIARRACSALQDAVNHPDFKRRVSSATYRETRFVDHDGNYIKVPREKIYGYIASGAEQGTANDATIAIQVSLKSMSSVGSTAIGVLPFSTAFWFINQCIEEDDHISLASHFIHEWLHVAGFYHHPNNGAREDVPYTVQEIVSDILKEMAAPPGHNEAAETSRSLAPVEENLLAAGCGAHETDVPADVPEPSGDDPIQ